VDNITMPAGMSQGISQIDAYILQVLWYGWVFMPL
jgi:hypothetical protein